MNATMLTQRDRDERLAQILEQFLADLHAGRAPRKTDLLARHPDLADDLEACLASLEYVGAAGVTANEATLAVGATAAVSRVLGDFRVLREIGRGGMGVVYEAEQISLGRRVALKILPFAGAIDQRRRQRFATEVQAAALLHHQNIVPVYHVGCERGVHYYAMQYVDGQALANVIAGMRGTEGGGRNKKQGTEGRSRGPGNSELQTQKSALGESAIPNQQSHIDTGPAAALSTQHSHDSRQFFESVARLGIQATEALEHARQAGIVHRDIKPGNLLVESNGKLWITDFGLARIGADRNLTVSGDLLGTIRYMSPEQALARRVSVDHRTDIYSLGATLYELLTLEPLISGEDRAEILHKIAFQEPRPPRRINRRVPVELETIILKATRKSPHERYATAQEMADDLQRFLDDRPIQARRPTIVERTRKWTRRHRQVVTACLALLILILITVGPYLAWHERRRAEEAEQARSRLAKSRLQLQRHQTRLQHQNYVLQIGAAYEELMRNSNAPAALKLLERCKPRGDEQDLRGFEWYMLYRLCEEAAQTSTLTADHMITSLAVSPDGNYVAACGAELWVPIGSTSTVWDLSTHRVIHKIGNDVHCVAFSADGQSLLTAHWSNQIRRWDIATGSELAALELPNTGQSDIPVKVLRSSGDGKWIAAASPSFGTVLVSAVDNGAERVLQKPRQGAHDLAFSPDGQTLAAAGKGGVKRWSTETGQRIGELLPTDLQEVFAVAFSSDGKLVAAGGADGQLFVWDAGSNKLLRNVCTNGGDVTALAFIDKHHLAASSVDKLVTVWRWRTGRREQDSHEADQQPEIRLRKGHSASVTSLVFVPGRHLLISGGKDQRIKLWDTRGGEDKSRLKAGASIAFSPDNNTLSTAGNTQWRLWALPSLAELPSFGKAAEFAVYSSDPEGQLIASTQWKALPDEDGKIRERGYFTTSIWDPLTRKLLARLPVNDIHGAHAWALSDSFSRDGRMLLTGGLRITLWDVVNPRRPREIGPIGDYGYKSGAWFFPKSNRIAAGGVSTTRIGIWSAPDRRHLASLEVQHCPRYIAISPDEKLIAVATVGTTIELWNVANLLRPERVAVLEGHGDAVEVLHFSPDGRTLASGSRDETVKLWNVPTCSLMLTLDDHDHHIENVRFSPDGRYLVTSSKDGAVYVRRASRP